MSAQPAAAPHVPFERAAVPQSDRGKRVKQRDYLPEGRIPVIDQGQSPVGGYTNDDDFAFIGELPVVLFGDHTRSVKLVDQRFAVGADGVKIFRPAEGVRAKYLYYWMKSAPLPHRGYGRHYQYLRQLSLPLPPPKQQDEIVAEIEKQFSRLDEAVANLKRVKANLKRYEAGVLNAAVDGRLVPTDAEIARARQRMVLSGAALLADVLQQRRVQWSGRGKYKEPAPVTESVEAAVPDGWTAATLNQLTLQIADVDHKMPRAIDHGIPYVSTKDFTEDDTIDFDGAKRISLEDFEALSRKIKPARGDLLLSRYGTVGEVRAVETDAPFQASYSVAIIKPVRGFDLADYLKIALRSDAVQAQIKRDVRATAQPDLGLAHIREIVIPLPPVSEQRRIVAEVDRRLSIVREVEAEVDANLARASALRQAVLMRGFG